MRYKWWLSVVAIVFVVSSVDAAITPVSAVPIITAYEAGVPGFPIVFRRVSLTSTFSATVTASDPTAHYALPWFSYLNVNGVTVYQQSYALSVPRGGSDTATSVFSVTWEANRTYDGTAILKTYMTNAILDSRSVQYNSGGSFAAYP